MYYERVCFTPKSNVRTTAVGVPSVTIMTVIEYPTAGNERLRYTPK